MGRRKWKLYQDGLIPKRIEGEPSSDDDSIAASDPPPALKIKTIEQINAPERTEEKRTEEKEEKPRRETILESLIKRPATQPKVELQEEPADWKPADRCYFCVDGERGEVADGRAAGGATSPASESDSSSVSGAKSPAAPPLLHHLLQLQLQGQNPQAIAQFQQMLAALAALGTGLVPPALTQAWMMQRLATQRPHADRLSESDKVAQPNSSPTVAEQPLDLSAKSTSSTSGTPPPDPKHLDNNRLKRAVLEGSSNSTRRAYTEDELQSALREIQSGRLGTRRAAVLYGIPRSTLRNKVNKFGLTSDTGQESEDSEPDKPDSPPSVILKIPTFPPPDDKSPSPATPVTTPVTPITPILPQPSLNPPSQFMPLSVFADPQPPTQQIFTSLSDVIAKSISQKFQQPLDRAPQPQDLPFMRQDRHVSVIKTPPDSHRNYAMPCNSKMTANNNGQPATGKGTRPKRGKYRNYDRDSLVEAVKAVQRGEMSVHRAGSYYGVPHSTLEYKVKERHLMRPRKREPKPPQDIKPQPPKPPPKPPTKPFTNGLNGPEGGYPPGYPFWPGAGFAPPPAPDLYASHMMRRLREEAPPPANGSFLEGIIRSSLERPGAALLQRLSAPPVSPPGAGGALRRRASPGEEPLARRPRLDSDHQLAAEMREAVQRLRAKELRPRNGTPTPPPAASPPDGAGCGERA